MSFTCTFQSGEEANEQKSLSASLEKLGQNCISSSFRKLYLKLEPYKKSPAPSCPREDDGYRWLHVPYSSAR